MALWILIHHHRHGIDVFPVEAASEEELPEPVDVIEAGLSTFEPEPEGDEEAEWMGPWRNWHKQDEPCTT